jgi:amidohydrolase
MIPTLEATAGKENVSITPAVTGAEDFSYYQKKFQVCTFFLVVPQRQTNIRDRAASYT